MRARKVELPWRPTCRAVPSRFPPISLFDDVASADELDAVIAFQNLTHPRLRQEVGEISLVAPEERVFGQGSTPVMAAFTHLNRAGSRFSDGSWGVYYAGDSLETAVAEVSFHAARFLSATNEPVIELDYRAYAADIREPLHDVRAARWQSIHDPDDYTASVKLAADYRAVDSWGLLYRSVRRPGAQCAAIFRPKAVELPVVQSAHVTLQWDGARITGWYRKSDHRPWGLAP